MYNTVWPILNTWKVLFTILQKTDSNQWFLFLSAWISSHSNRMQAWHKVFTNQQAKRHRHMYVILENVWLKYWGQTMTRAYDTFSHHHLEEFSISNRRKTIYLGDVFKHFLETSHEINKSLFSQAEKFLRSDKNS